MDIYSNRNFSFFWPIEMYICEVNDIDRYRERDIHKDDRVFFEYKWISRQNSRRKRRREKKAEKDREENNLP